MKIAYVAGPYTADRLLEVELNIMAAGSVAYELWRMGYAVICPHTNSTFSCRKQLNDGIPYIKGDLEIISRFHGGKDCLVMLPGWEESKGARAEREFASNRGLNIFYWPEDKEKLARFVV